VILDADLSDLYKVSTKALNQAVKRNRKRFPADFTFRLTKAETREVVTVCDHLSGLKYSPVLPHAFTEHGAIMAAAALGLNERAYTYLRNVMPASHNDRAEVRQVEPYVVCQSTHGRSCARHGVGRVSWLSGAAVWNYVAMTTAILGIQSDYCGLRLQPCVPAHWKHFSVTRRFRGATFHIMFDNTAGRGVGTREIVLGDTPVSGNILPDLRTGTHVVKVVV